MDARREATLLQAEVAARGTPTRAAGAKAYMRSDLDFTGTTVPDLRRIARAWLRAHKDLDANALRAVADALWAPTLFESRLLATILLQQRSDLVRTTDLPWLEGLLRACRAWALLDNLAPYAVADLLARSPALRKTTLSRWSRDDDFWMRRTALLTMHRDLARGDGDWALWTRLAATHLEDQPRWRRNPPTTEERFFIRKALGWVLRDRTRTRPQDTVAFVRQHQEHLSGLTLREATRRLPPAQRP